MNRKEKNQLKKIQETADDFYTGFHNDGFAEECGGIDKLLRNLFNSLDAYQGKTPPVSRKESVMHFKDVSNGV